MMKKQLIVVVEGTAAMGPFWSSILLDYVEKIVRYFQWNDIAGQKNSCSAAEFSLVVFSAHGPYSSCLVQRTGWTNDADTFMKWLSFIPFTGGGFGEVAIGEGLAEALMMFSSVLHGSQTQQNVECQKHCVLVAASNPYTLPTPVFLPHIQNLEQNESKEMQIDSCLSDAESVAKWFSQCSVSLSVISPKHLPKLRAIYTAGKPNSRVADPVVDNVKNPQILVLLSENFVEARNSLSRSSSNQSPVKLDAPISSVTSNLISSGNASVLNRQQVSVGNIATASVKLESTAPASNGPTLPNVPPLVSHASSQGLPSVLTSSPSVTQDMSNNDIASENKPIVNGIQPNLRAMGSAPANVNILNNLSQARVYTTANTMNLQTVGGPSMAMHMSNMISSGTTSSALPASQNVFSSGQSVISSSGSGPLVGTSSVSQNTSLSSFTSAAPNTSGNSNIGVSQPMNNIQGTVGLGQSLSNIVQGGLSSAAKVGQSSISINQSMLNNQNTSSITSGASTMIPTPGMSQPMQSGIQTLGVANGSAANIPVTQHSTGITQQSKYLKVWEGALSGQRQGQPIPICQLEGYRNASSSELLATDWPQTMQIVRLISQDHMSNKQYVGKAEILVFRTLSHHGFLSQLQQKKLCAVIQLPTQTLLLSVSDKGNSRLIGMLFPGDMVVFKPQNSSQQQQQQQQQYLQQQKQQPQYQQPPQHLQHQQQQTQQTQSTQLVGTGMNQTFIQGQSRSQIISQGQVPSQSQQNLPGNGFLG